VHFPSFLTNSNIGGIPRVVGRGNDFSQLVSRIVRSSLSLSLSLARAYFSSALQEEASGCLIREGGTGDYSEPL